MAGRKTCRQDSIILDTEVYPTDFVFRYGVVLSYTGTNPNPVIPNTAHAIGPHAFEGTDIVSVAIPDSVTEIGAYAFADCGQLQTVLIPDSVTRIGAKAFLRCASLQQVSVPDYCMMPGGSDHPFSDTHCFQKRNARNAENSLCF